MTGRSSRRWQELRRLRREHGERTLLEGPHLIGEALAAGLSVESVLVTSDFLAGAGGRRLQASLPVVPEVVEAARLEAITDSDSPRGALAVARLPRGGAASLPAGADLYVYAEGLQDPGNLGALARVAEAAGAGGLALAPGSVSPNHPRALRASAGSLLRLPVAVRADPDELADHLGSLTWVALLPRGGTPLWEAPLAGRLLLAVGAEGPGLSPALQGRCRAAVTVPVAPPVESLNVTVAVALVLFEVARRRAASAGSS